MKPKWLFVGFLLAFILAWSPASSGDSFAEAVAGMKVLGYGRIGSRRK